MILEQNSSMPLYEQLKNAIKENIQSGKYPAGFKIPNEEELCIQYSVSRITVRRSVKDLCDEGYLVKKQGKGTFVLDIAKIPVMWSQGFHDVWEKRGKTVTTEFAEKRIIRLDGDYRCFLNLGEEDEVLYIKRIMNADGVAKMVDVEFLPLKLYPGILDEIGENDSVFHVLRTKYGFLPHSYYKVIKVKLADTELSGFLSCEKGSPLFDLFKISYDASHNPVYLSISYSKWDDVSYVISGKENDEGSYNGLNWRQKD